MSNPIEDRLAKLLALAHHTETNPNEAANAAAAAARLAAQHGIDLDALRAKQVGPKHGCEVADWHFQDCYTTGVWVVTVWVGKLFGCEPLLVKHPTNSQVKVSFYGKPHNTKLALSWTKYLWDSCVLANTEHAVLHKYGSNSARQAARENFRAAFFTHVALRLKQKFEAMRRETIKASDGRSLMLVAHLDAELTEAREYMNSLSLDLATQRVQEPDYLTEAFAAGARAARGVSLEDQIEQ